MRRPSTEQRGKRSGPIRLEPTSSTRRMLCVAGVCGALGSRGAPARGVEGLVDNPVDRQPSQRDKPAYGRWPSPEGQRPGTRRFLEFEVWPRRAVRGFERAAEGSGRGRVGRRRITSGRTRGSDPRRPSRRPVFSSTFLEDSARTGSDPPNRRPLSKGLILAQNERWRRGLGMQVVRPARGVAQG